ncbi:MAG: TRAP transporter large permease [Lawsonibacter sp.]|jgi:C4-dicarboxylate transporter DctM subunit
MTPLNTTILLFGMLLFLLFFNAPLIVAIGLPTALVMLMSGMNVATFGQRMFVAVDSFTMMAIPFFMLAGKLMEVGGMSKRIVRFANSLVGWMQGGLAHVVVVACAFFGALSGSAAATCAAIGSTLIPDMKKEGYPSDFVAGLTAVSGGLGVIIPPSITMIMYGVCSGTSIGKLFVAGFVPGILLAIFLMVTARIEAGKRKIQQTSTFNTKELVVSFLDAIPALLVPIIILGGIYGGFFSPTEAGAVACVYGFLIAIFWYREVNKENIGEVMGGALTNTVLVLIIVSASGAFSWLLTSNGVASLLGDAVGSIATNKFVFLLISNLIFLFVGCFIESVAGILIVTPILLPQAEALGIDPVHYGIIMVVNLALGLCTPPVGENQYIAAAIAEIPFEKEFKASVPFLIANFAALIVITYVPQLSLWLPSLLE